MDKKIKTPPTLVIRRTIHAKREKVFEAWSDPAIMNQWFFCGDQAIVTNDFRTGGNYQNKMIFKAKVDGAHACSSPSETTTYTHSGEYLEIIPPEKLVFTWNSHLVKDSRVTIELRDLGDATELTLTHELLETEVLRQQHTEGWEGCLANLSNFFG